MAHASRKQYFVVFAWLFVLTILEVAVVKFEIGKLATGLALVGLAVTKAAAVGLFYMHLKSEVRVLKLMVVVPLCIPPIYALVLCVEAAVRLGGWG